MTVSKFKLANVVLEPKEHMRQFPEMLYRVNGGVDYAVEDGSLGFVGSLDFLTYFNALSSEKWRRYASVHSFKLHLELVGDACDVQLTGVRREDAEKLYQPDRFEYRGAPSIKAELETVDVGRAIRFEGAAEYAALDIDVPVSDMLLCGFTLASHGATAVRDSYWYAEVDESAIRPIRLALVTTTFNNEHYILPNIDAIKGDVLASDDPIAERFHMFVVDNGRSLDVDAVSDQGVTVIPNANVGGSGGFARGMMEALEEGSYTHVLLMDDDVSIYPESIKRTFNLLSLANDEYEDAFINGAMIQLEHPNVQHEDVATVMPSGIIGRIKGHLFIDRIQDIAVNEVIDVEVPNAYGAWWYACIPVSAIRANGLPLPLFIRCDDVEYGIRCNPTYMTMNGICVWHAQFEDRFRPSVDCYQYIRNFLVMMSCNGRPNTASFMIRTNRMLTLYLRQLGYDAAELIVSGLEDYLKGPELLMQGNGEAIFKEKARMNERLLPLDEALDLAVSENPSLAERLDGFEPNARALSTNVPVPFYKALCLVRTLPYDKHLLPEFLLRDKPATTYYGRATQAPAFSETGAKILVACDRSGELAHVRVMDRARGKAIRRRWRKALKEYYERKDELERAYREALPKMASVGFWREHLSRALEG